MAYNDDSYFSSFNDSFHDPPLFDDGDAYVGDAPVLDWSEFDHGLAGTQSLLHHGVSPYSADSQSSGNTSFHSPFSGQTSFSSAYSDISHVRDWHLFEETVNVPAIQALARQYRRYETAQSTPAISPAAMLLPSTASSSPSSSQDQPPSPIPVEQDRSSKVPIQRARPRSRKSNTGISISRERYHCTEGRCRVSFSRPSDLNRHAADVHGRSANTYNCDLCVYYSRRGDKVKEHCQKMHHQPRGFEQYTVKAVAKT